MYMYMYYVNMYVYIYIPCTSASIRPKHAMTSGRSSRSASSSGSASAVFDGSGSSCAAWAPRSSAATAGPPAAPVDRWSQPKNPWNFFVAFACFFRCDNNQTEKKTKKQKKWQFQELWRFFKNQPLPSLVHWFFVTILVPTWLRDKVCCCRALRGLHLVHQRSKVGGASSLWEVESPWFLPHKKRVTFFGWKFKNI